MNYFLIKSLNCIVSDAEIKEGDYIKWYVLPLHRQWIDKVTLNDVAYYEIMSNQGVKVEYSNNKIEGLKTFDLDEVEDLALKEFPVELRNGLWNSQLVPYDVNGKEREIFIAGYKAKAGYNLKDLSDAFYYAQQHEGEDLDTYLKSLLNKPVEVELVKEENNISIFKIK